MGSRIHYMLHKCYTLITLLIAISYRIPRMREACHVEGLIPSTLWVWLFSRVCYHDNTRGELAPLKSNTSRRNSQRQKAYWVTVSFLYAGVKLCCPLNKTTRNDFQFFALSLSSFLHDWVCNTKNTRPNLARQKYK